MPPLLKPTFLIFPLSTNLLKNQFIVHLLLPRALLGSPVIISSVMRERDKRMLLKTFCLKLQKRISPEKGEYVEKIY